MKEKVILFAIATMLAMGVRAQETLLTISQSVTPAAKVEIYPNQKGIVFLDMTLTMNGLLEGSYLQIGANIKQENIQYFEDVHLEVNGQRWGTATFHQQGIFLEVFQSYKLSGQWNVKIVGDVAVNAPSSVGLQFFADATMFPNLRIDTTLVPQESIVGSATGSRFSVNATAAQTGTLAHDENHVAERTFSSGTASIADAHVCQISQGEQTVSSQGFGYQVYPADPEMDLSGIQAQLYVDDAPLGAPRWIDASNQIMFNETLTFFGSQSREISVELIGTSAVEGVFQVGLIDVLVPIALKWNEKHLNDANPMLGSTLVIGSGYTARLTCEACLSPQSFLPTTDGMMLFRGFLTNTSGAGSKSGFEFRLSSDSIDFTGWKASLLADNFFIGNAEIALDGEFFISRSVDFELGETKEMTLLVFSRGDVNGSVHASLTRIQGESVNWNGAELSESNPFIGPEMAIAPLMEATIYCEDCLEPESFEIVPNTFDAISFEIKNNSNKIGVLQGISFMGVSPDDRIGFTGWRGQTKINYEPTLPKQDFNFDRKVSFSRNDQIAPGETKHVRLIVNPVDNSVGGDFRIGVSGITGTLGDGDLDVYYKGSKISPTNPFWGPMFHLDANGELIEDTTSTKSAVIHEKSLVIKGDGATKVLEFFIENGENNVPLSDISIELQNADGSSGGTHVSDISVQLYVDDEELGSPQPFYNALRLWESIPFELQQTKKISIWATGLTEAESNQRFVVTQIRGGFNIVWEGQQLSPFNPFYGPTISTITAVDNIPLDSEVRLYPNPIRDRILVQGLPLRSVYRVYTTAGQVLQTAEFEHEINCQSWQPGMYIVHFQLPDGQTIAKKVIKN